MLTLEAECKLRDRIEQRIADDPLHAAEIIVNVIGNLQFVEERLSELQRLAPTSLGYVRDAIQKLEKFENHRWTSRNKQRIRNRNKTQMVRCKNES